MGRFLWPAAVLLAVMLALPWLAVTFVPGVDGMAVCFILFFAVNPLAAVGAGILAGWRRQWFWPVAAAGMFLLGAWLIFAPGETAFVLYAGVYLALGLAAMALTRLMLNRLKGR